MSSFLDGLVEQSRKSLPNHKVTDEFLQVVQESLPEIRWAQYRREMWLSPSVLAKMCPRALTAYIRDEVEGVRDIPPDINWAGHKGTAFHSVFQDGILGPIKAIKGGWVCSRCGHIHGIDPDDKVEVYAHGETFIDKITPKSAVVRPAECEKCAMRPGWDDRFFFIEPLVYDLEIRVVGRMDGIILLPSGEVVWDLKSSKIPWRGVPYQEHQDQVLWYMGLSGIHRGMVVYVKQEERQFEGSVVPMEVVWDELRWEQMRKFAHGLQKINSESSLPDCPHGGTRFGRPCDCSGM